MINFITKIARKRNSSYHNVIINNDRCYVTIKGDLVPILISYNNLTNEHMYLYSNSKNDSHEIGYKSEKFTKGKAIKLLDNSTISDYWIPFDNKCKVVGSIIGQYFIPTKIKYG